MAYIPETNSVVAFQSDPTKLLTHSSVSGTVNIGTQSGSVVAFPTGNQSVSGTVLVNNGSVAAWLNSSNASVITVGSPVANQSVSGSVGIVGTPSISGDVRIIGSVNTVIIGGSIAATFTPPANQSVSGTVQVSGNPSISGTVQVGNFPTNQNVSGSVVAFINGTVPVNTAGSVVAFQGTSPWAVDTNNRSVITLIQGSVAVSVTPAANQSVSGTVQTDVQGSVAVVVIGGSIATATTNSSVMLLNSANVIGSVTALQGTPEWTVKSSLTGGIFPISGSVAVGNFPTNQNVSGSVVAFISGTVPVNTAGSVVAFQGTSPWVVNFQNSSIITQVGTRTTSLVSTVPSSVIVGASIFGQLPAGTAVLGSVATLQGTNPWITTFSNSSILAVPVGSTITVSTGSIITVEKSSSILSVPVGSTIVIVQGSVATTGGTFNASIQGTVPVTGPFAEDSAHTTGDYGFPTWGVRNDNTASFVSANLDYAPIGVDSAGRNLIKPFAAEESRIEGYHSVVSTSVTTLVAAAGAGIRNYITDIILANTGATTTLVTFRSGGGTSVLGYGIAPTGGGSNMIGFQTPLRTLANETFDFQATTSTSVLYATVKGFKAP